MSEFDTLEFVRIEGSTLMSGKRAWKIFPNGYGVSVICHSYSYGGPEGLYELAVLDETGGLVVTPVNPDQVIGWLTPDDVSKLMEQVKALGDAPKQGMFKSIKRMAGDVFRALSK